MPPSKFDAPLRNVCRKASQCIPPTSPCVICPLRGVKSLFSLFYVVFVLIDVCRARLQIIIELPDEDDEGSTISHFYTCDIKDTVQQAGIAEASMLRVVADDEPEPQANDSWNDQEDDMH